MSVVNGVVELAVESGEQSITRRGLVLPEKLFRLAVVKLNNQLKRRIG